MRPLYLITVVLLLVTGHIRAQDSWQQKSNYPAGIRIGAVSFTIGDKAYIGTGSDDVVNHDDFWQYDPATDTWTQKANFGGGIRYFGSAFAVNGKGYAGMGLVGSYNWRKDIWEYDPVANTWTRKNDFPGQYRYTAVSFSIGNKGYLGTGNYRISPAYDAEYQNDFWEYDPGTDIWTRKADVPQQGRTNACGFSIGNKGYIGTGFYYYDTRLNDLWEYDPGTNAWTRKADMPATPRFGAQGLSIDNKGYVMQGWYYSALNDTWEYDPASNSWTQKTSMPGTARNSGVAFSINHRGYIGMGSDAVGALQDMWQYSPQPVAPPVIRFEPTRVSTFAGDGQPGLINGASAAARFSNPTDVAVTADKIVYIADKGNHVIRKIKQGLVTLFAGNGLPGFADGGGSNAHFNNPAGIDVDPDGIVYVADETNNRIRKITPAGLVSTFAGSGVAGFADGEGVDAQFNAPSDVVVDKYRNVYVVDRGNRRIRKIHNSGHVSTLAGNGGYGNIDGPGSEASFLSIYKMVLGKDGYLYVTQLDGPIRKIAPDGTVSSLTVPGMYGYKYGITSDTAGYFYTSVLFDIDSNQISGFGQSLNYSYLAGGKANYQDGYGKQGQLNYGDGMAVEASQNILIADVYNNRIRRLSLPDYYFKSTLNQPSSPQPVQISGSFLLGAINVSASDGYEISIDSNGSYTSSLQVSPVSGEVMSTVIYVRLAAQNSGGDKPGKLTIQSAGVNNRQLALNGHIVVPTVYFDRNFVTSWVGNLEGGFTNGSRTAARFHAPMDIATDKWGNTYVADMSNNSIRKITPDGLVSTLAGSGVRGYADGIGSLAQFNAPFGLAVDGAGNVYVADQYNQRIRKITPDGNVTTIAGDGSAGYLDGPALSARFHYPYDVAVDESGNVFVADHFNNRIRKISTSGVVSTFAGDGSNYSVDGTGTEASFYDPQYLAFDKHGNLWETESYGQLRKITPDAVVTTYSSNLFTGFHSGLVIDSADNIYVSSQTNGDFSYIIRHLNSGGDIRYAGDSTGYRDGAGDTARFIGTVGLAIDREGNLLSADAGSNIIRKLTLPNLVFSTVSGIPSPVQFISVSGGDLSGEAVMEAPAGYELATDSLGPFAPVVQLAATNGEINAIKVYVRLAASAAPGSHAGNLQLHSNGTANQYLAVTGFVFSSAIQFDPSLVTTIAGNGQAGLDNGDSAQASFRFPRNVVVDPQNNIYVADQSNHVIRKISAAGVVSTFAGSGTAGFADGQGAAASFSSPAGIAIDHNGNLYVADETNQRIRKITPGGMVSTLAGNGESGLIDGEGVAARFNSPIAVAVDADDNIYVADNANHSIRKITPTGYVTTIAGTGEQGVTDGTGINASFNSPNNLAVDPSGNIYVTEWYGPLRKISPLGVVSTIRTEGFGFDLFQDGLAIDRLGNIYLSVIMGNSQNAIYRLMPSGNGKTVAGSVVGFADGDGTVAKFWDPAGLAMAPDGSVVVADYANNRIRRISVAGINLSTQGGIASVPGTLSVSGTRLSNSLNILAPAHFEVALSQAGPYNAQQSVSPAEGEVRSQLLFVRLKANNRPGIYHELVTLESNNAAGQTIQVNGTVIDTVPPVVTVVPSVTLCNQASGPYNIPALTATDISGIKSVSYAISGATSRAGQGYNASGAFNPGYSTIKWTVTDSSGNVAVAQTIVRVNTAINVSIPNVMPGILFGRPNTIYIGYGLQCVYLSATVTGGVRPPAGYKFQWSTGATTSYINVCGTTPGTYTYTVTVTDSLGCQATVSKVIHVVDVRCGPQNNKVLVCFTIFGRTSTQCYTPAQATLALLIGAQLGPCGSTLASEPVTAKAAQPNAAEWINGQLLITPNPNNGHFRLQWKGVVPKEIRIYDQNGKPVYSRMIGGALKDQVIDIQCGPLANGMYIVQVIGKDGMLTGKMLVQ